MPGLDELRELHRRGELARVYPTVAGLLTDLTDADLARAGRLLATVDPDAVLAEHPAVPLVRIAVTGHGTVSPLVPALTAELARHGLLARPWVGDFDGYVFELSDPDSALHKDRPDIVLCLLDPMVVIDELPVPWRPEDAAAVWREKLALLDSLAGTYERHGTGTLVLNTVPLSTDLTAQLVDHRSRAELGALWRDANAALLRLTAANRRLVVLDVEAMLAEGIPVTDPRTSVYAKAHLSSDLLARYAREVGHLARALTGRTRKCLALDLDNTLWGGILGDDGPDGIEVADSLRGEAFQAFQRVVRQLGAQGVLLAAVSKNDPEPVRQVLAEHPRMTLRDNHFVRVIANWDPKPGNLTGLAADLNVGVDSLVFVDDSPFECGLVRHELPAVAVVPLDQEPALHARKLLRDGWFDVLDLTTEDRARPATYRDELARRDFQGTFHSIEQYLDQLGVTVRLAPVRPAEVPRVSQLTLRTNQFNLTTRRLGPAEVAALAADPTALVLAVHAADRFGDNGLVGSVFLRRDGATLHIDNFLLSCRVFARGIEHACVSAILRHAAHSATTAVVGTYRPTAKNHNFEGFYPSCGFVPLTTGAADDPDTATFRHDLRQIPAPPRHVALSTSFDLTASFEGSPR